MSTQQSVTKTHPAKLALFWLYVIAPLTWGVVNTLLQAMKLFH
ncbi:oxalate:formate antiporter [Paraburkholderia sp.]|nr:oxalate:formate antiporter [Paraburkholderia sp.]MDE1179754.1 oxalate:formate antiporter [Paraburkholderia sp.]